MKKEQKSFPIMNGVNGYGRNYIWIKALAFGLIIISPVVLYKLGWLDVFLDKNRLTMFLDSLGPWAFLGFVVLQAGQVIVAPIPGEITGLIGGYTFGPVLGVILSSTGLTLGSFAAFSLSKAFGRPVVERFVSKSIMDRFDYLLHHKGLFLIFLLFLIPGFPKDSFCYILGLGHLSTAEFIIVSSVGRVLGTTLLTLGGGYIRHQEYTKFFILVGVAAVVIVAAIAYRKKLEDLFRLLHSKSREKRALRCSEGGSSSHERGKK
jgi:uncharacterized membrane protein YdjX (TVP38/TMEM64 family)